MSSRCGGGMLACWHAGMRRFAARASCRGVVTVARTILVALHIGLCRGALVHALGVPML